MTTSLQSEWGTESSRCQPTNFLFGRAGLLDTVPGEAAVQSLCEESRLPDGASSTAPSNVSGPRHNWTQAATRAHEAACSGGGCYSILKINTDHFRAYNEQKGRESGDTCLGQVAERIRWAAGADCKLACGGDADFVLLLERSDGEQALSMAERVRTAVWDCNLPHPASPTADRVTVSIGVASYPAPSWEHVESRADEALYVAKILGRNLIWGDACRANNPQPTPHATTILVIDDDAGDAELLRRHVEMVFDRPHDFIHCANADLARPYMKARGGATVFLDYRLGAENGLQVLREMRKSGFLGPIIVATGQGDENTAADILRAGADDYVPKGSLSGDLLKRVLRNAGARFAGRCVEARNRHLLAELQTAARSLEGKNRRLAELYHTAHQFVDNVSHEFRTPLSVIKEFTSILRDGLAGPLMPEQTEYLDIVLNRTDDLGTMIEDMLDSSKLEAGMLRLCRKTCHLRQIVETVRPTLERKAAAARMNLALEIPADLPNVYCDPEKIGRVIINLIVNALKYCPEGSAIEVKAEPSADREFLLVHVCDNGPGISPEDLRLIFDRFRQAGSVARTSMKGFGLGLSIVKQLVQLHLGQVSVRSALGGGSTFTFSVPTAAPDNVLRIHCRQNDQSILSLLIISSAAENPDERLCFAEFLERQLRHTDLLFPAGANRWLLIASSGPLEIQLLRERLEKAVVEANRNRPGHPIPAIVVKQTESYRGADQHERLVRMLDAAIDETNAERKT